MNKIGIAFTLAVFLLLGCSSSDKNTPSDDSNPEIITKPFTEGVFEMGIFSNDIDLGKLIGKIDFSKTDAKQQFEKLLEKDQETKVIFDLIQKAGDKNPLAALAMTFNIAESTYYLKNDVVLGKVRGFGWEMDNYHNKAEDRGSVYLETLVQTNLIADQDKKIYSLYQPSKSSGEGAMNDIDFNQYNRKVQSTKQNILGYECDVIVYTPKTTDADEAVQLNQLVVYTSPLFNNTINFTHSYYLEENGGILRLDIYLADNKTPTLVMKPKSIKAQTVALKDLTSRTTTPVYTEADVNWAFKSLAIMMSGWGLLEN